MRTTRSVKCPVPGFETCEAEFNMLATDRELSAMRLMPTQETAKPVISDVRGWDADKYGPDYMGDNVPIAFKAWLVWIAWGDALRDFISDPN
jgi:hypothetical protein